MGRWSQFDRPFLAVPIGLGLVTELRRRSAREGPQRLDHRRDTGNSSGKMVAEHFAQSAGPDAQDRAALQRASDSHRRSLPFDAMSVNSKKFNVRNEMFENGLFAPLHNTNFLTFALVSSVLTGQSFAFKIT